MIVVVAQWLNLAAHASALSRPLQLPTFSLSSIYASNEAEILSSRSTIYVGKTSTQHVHISSNMVEHVDVTHSQRDQYTRYKKVNSYGYNYSNEHAIM